MKRKTAAILALCVTSIVAKAWGQPELDDPTGLLSPHPASDRSTTDDPEVIALFDEAVAALLDGNYETAAVLFSNVAARSVEPERRAAAVEMARQATKWARTASQAHGGASRAKPVDLASQKPSYRPRLLATTIVVGLNYGWLVPAALDIDDPKTFVGLYLVTSATSFAVPYLVTRGDHITLGMSILGGSGAVIGAGHGALLFAALAGKDGFDGSSLRFNWAAMLGASILEGGAGYLWARETGISAGKASAITTGSLLGAGYGLGSYFVFDNEGDDEGEVNLQLLAGTVLAASAAGIVGGVAYDAWRHPSEGDVSLMSLAVALGAYTTMTPLVSADAKNRRSYAGFMLAGATLGLVVGDQVTKDVNYSSGESLLVALGTLAGGLLGAGTGFLLSSDNNPERVILPASAGGAIAGLLLMLAAIDPSGKDTTGKTTVQLTPMLGDGTTTGLSWVGRF